MAADARPRRRAPALDAVIAEAEPQLLAIAERLCASPADARDLVQDALERAMRQGIPDDVRNPRAYLATIMHNLFIDRCRAASAIHRPNRSTTPPVPARSSRSRPPTSPRGLG